MRRYKTQLISFLLLFSSSLIAQESSLGFGLKGGVNFSSASPKELGNRKIKFGYQIETFAEYGVTESFYLQSGMNFATKGIRLMGTEIINGGESGWKQTVEMQYLEVPLLSIYKIEMTTDSQVLFYIGPYVAYGIGGEISLYNEIGGDSKRDAFDDGVMKRVDYGVRFGTGMTFGNYMYEFCYDFGLANIKNGDEELFKGKRYRNKGFSLLMGYRF